MYIYTYIYDIYICIYIYIYKERRRRIITFPKIKLKQEFLISLIYLYYVNLSLQCYGVKFDFE